MSTEDKSRRSPLLPASKAEYKAEITILCCGSILAFLMLLCGKSAETLRTEGFSASVELPLNNSTYTVYGSGSLHGSNPSIGFTFTETSHGKLVDGYLINAEDWGVFYQGFDAMHTQHYWRYPWIPAQVKTPNY